MKLLAILFIIGVSGVLGMSLKKERHNAMTEDECRYYIGDQCDAYPRNERIDQGWEEYCVNHYIDTWPDGAGVVVNAWNQGERNVHSLCTFDGSASGSGNGGSVVGLNREECYRYVDQYCDTYPDNGQID